LGLLLSGTALDIPARPVHQQLIQTRLNGGQSGRDSLPQPMAVPELLGGDALNNPLSV
jgi:hypothetical protein